jgi:hypothetical protein
MCNINPSPAGKVSPNDFPLTMRTLYDIFLDDVSPYEPSLTGRDKSLDSLCCAKNIDAGGWAYLITYFKVAVVIIYCLYLTYRLGTYSYTVRNIFLFNCYNNGLRVSQDRGKNCSIRTRYWKQKCSYWGVIQGEENIYCKD